MNDKNETTEYGEFAACIAKHLGLRLDGLVGSGAYKHTFRVETKDGLVKALKLYKSGANARTEREVDAMQRCSHPAVARFETLNTWMTADRNVLYSIEEYLDGGTFTALTEKGLLNNNDIRSYALQIIDAIDHLASLDLVHRDIKPDNIMLRADSGRAVLVDFGLVRDLSKPSITKTWAQHGPGTPYYSSPEQLNNEKELIDWRSDQFSLAIVLAEAGFGKHPFWPDNTEQWEAIDAVALRKKTTEDFHEWAKRNHPTLLKMLSLWPVERFRTPFALRNAWNKKEY
jgi:serine/threonine protein kinase